jgi:hypothetical protein
VSLIGRQQTDTRKDRTIKVKPKPITVKAPVREKYLLGMLPDRTNQYQGFGVKYLKKGGRLNE